MLFVDTVSAVKDSFLSSSLPSLFKVSSFCCRSTSGDDMTATALPQALSNAGGAQDTLSASRRRSWTILFAFFHRLTIQSCLEEGGSIICSPRIFVFLYIFSLRATFQSKACLPSPVTAMHPAHSLHVRALHMAQSRLIDLICLSGVITDNLAHLRASTARSIEAEGFKGLDTFARPAPT